MEFGILGPLLISGDGGPVQLPRKPRAVLSALLLHPNQIVSRDRLIAAVWERPPRSAVSNLQTYVSQIRRAAIDVETCEPGYRLRADPGRLDLLAFGEAVQGAREDAARDDLAAAHVRFQRAFRLWRGRPAEDAPLARTLAARIAELEEQADRARADWTDVRLALGLHQELITELYAQLEADPLRERPWRQLMLALHGAGRRAEALDAYIRARKVLVDELGVEPGPELRELHGALLAGEQAHPPVRRAAPAWIGLCQLPADLGDFVGRTAELASVTGALDRGGSAPAIVVVSGPPGTGKSTLAVHAAHRVRERYPDGQLFARLGGMDPRDALAELLKALGVDGEMLPAATEDRAAMYRARVADRAVLVVLDDARDELQVQHLLPGTPRSAVIVTSRGPLAALPGATAVPLEVLPFEDAERLLAGIAGPDRVAAAPDSAETIVRVCGRLPLAIRIAGARLATRPAWPLADFAERISSASLDELRYGRLDVRSTYAMGFAPLSIAARRAFLMFGVTGLDSVADWSMRALLGQPPRLADQAVEDLATAGLITASEIDGAGQARYRMHDLLRDFARELAVDGQADALRRLSQESLERLMAATTELPLPLVPPAPDALPRTTPAGPRRRAWLLAERKTLLAVAQAAAPSMAARLAEVITPFLTIRGFHDDADRLLSAVSAVTDRKTARRLRLMRVDVGLDRGRPREVVAELRELLAAAEADGDQHEAAYALTMLGTCAAAAGDLGRALAHTTLAADRFLEYGDTNGLANAWIAMSVIHLHQARWPEAAEVCELGLVLTGGAQNAQYHAELLRGLGIARFEMGKVENAVEHYEESLRLARELDWAKGERMTLRRLGEAHAALGHFEQATAMLAECGRMFAAAGDVHGEALTEFALGETRRWRGDEQAALGHFLTCSALLGPLGEPTWRVRTLKEIARSRAALATAGRA
ncbi:BTAD domain-containing putative transcriptional regulator [Nonomuraea sp. NPDC050394]|uniref:AfsR/SARP family transcriptional regulator n=1 Tax=Nonomuraea sp. NPDC050394 TaxID=3364363 RepID=UPI0037A3ADF1